MRFIDEIIVHASATSAEMDVGVREITAWHTDPREDEASGMLRYQGQWYKSDEDLPPAVRGRRGNGWNDIGYHYVIRRNGDIETGRRIDIPGAHARGHNENSIGICLIGGVDANDRKKATANFTLEQYLSLNVLIEELKETHGDMDIFGHREVDPLKACPCFDVRAFLANQ